MQERTQRERSASRGHHRAAARGSRRPTVGVITSGDAKNYGSRAGAHLNQPIVGIGATPTGARLLARRAATAASSRSATPSYYGSSGAIRLRRPILSMQTTPDRPRLLARRVRRRRLHLRRRPLPRIGRQHPVVRAVHGHGAHTERARLLARQSASARCTRSATRRGTATDPMPATSDRRASLRHRAATASIDSAGYVYQRATARTNKRIPATDPPDRRRLTTDGASVRGDNRPSQTPLSLREVLFGEGADGRDGSLGVVEDAVDDADDVVALTRSMRATRSSRLGTSPSTISARPRRRMRLADVSSDIASDPMRWPFAAVELVVREPVVDESLRSRRRSRRASRARVRARCRRRRRR